MKNQALFSSKDKSKKLKCCLLQFLFGDLRVETNVLFLICLIVESQYSITVKILKFGTPQTIAISVLKLVKFDVTLH